jgi:diguanylate cyclase (GGDEF)-like protein/PAS domain S-box-containing protein
MSIQIRPTTPDDPYVQEVGLREGPKGDLGSLGAALPAEVRAIGDRTTSPLLVVDPGGTIRYANPAAARLVGWSPPTLHGTQVLNFVHPADQKEVEASLTRVLAGKSSDVPVEYRVKGADGSWKTLALVATTLLYRGTTLGILVSGTDVTALRAQESYLRDLAFRDHVTALPNRRSLLQRLHEELPRRQHLAVAFIDIDHFKRITDSLGHSFGDSVLRATGSRLLSLLPPGGFLAHFYADTFVVVLVDLDPERAVHFVWELLRAVATPLFVEGRELNLAATAGVAVRDAATAPDCILRDADAALTRGKAQRRGGVEVFNEEMRTQAVERLAMEGELRHAVERNELSLVVQPVVYLPNREVAGGEALLRWTRRGGDAVSPDVFIGLAEETGLITSIGDWVLARAIGTLIARKVSRISVNLSPRQLVDPGLPARVERLLGLLEVPPGRLLFEVTENFVVDNFDIAAGSLANLRQLGCPVGLDDFGTGYSSLGYLRQLPVDFLKLDRELVQDVDTDPQAARIAETIVSLARTLSLATIAEGIERETQAHELNVMGCHYGQGWLFGRPGPVEHHEVPQHVVNPA